MTSFSGCTTDLQQKLGFELEVLNSVRGKLFTQSEAHNFTLTVDLSDPVNEDGLRLSKVENISVLLLSDADVRSQLSELRPLFFVTAFKIHDMIGEWVLLENKCSKFQFSEKIKCYNSKYADGTLVEPSVFADCSQLSIAFWEIYEKLADYRNTVAHQKVVEVKGDGSLILRRKDKDKKDKKTEILTTLELSNNQQASYTRFICFIAEALIGSRELDDINKYIVINDLSELGLFYNKASFLHKPFRYEKMRMKVPESALERKSPISFNVDFDQARRQMEQVFPTSGSEVLLFDLLIEVSTGDKVVKWFFPTDAIPNGSLLLMEGDDKFDQFLIT